MIRTGLGRLGEAVVSDPGYQEIHRHRAAALSQGDLIATSKWVLG